MTTEDKINGAGVIVLASHVVRDGKLRRVVNEMLKHDAGVLFNLKVGGAIRRETMRNGVDEGGAPIFFRGLGTWS